MPYLTEDGKLMLAEDTRVLLLEGDDAPLDHNGGVGVIVDGVLSTDPDQLRYITPKGFGVEFLQILAYVKSEYDAGLRNPVGQAWTGADGRWLAPMHLLSGVYYLVADIVGDGYLSQVNTVEVP
jgi:hypothetical protein